MKKKLAITLFSLVTILSTNAAAQSMKVDDFGYRDYIDFGQNKGQFGASNSEKEITSNHGGKITLEKMPNFSSKSNNGNLTSVGRNVVVTANHITTDFVAINYNKQHGFDNFNSFGNTAYQIQTGQHSTKNTLQNYGSDTLYLKTDKYIVEGNIKGFDPTGVTSIKDHTATNVEQNKNKIIEHIKKFVDDPENGKIAIFQAGSGWLKVGDSGNIFEGDGNSVRGGGIHNLMANGVSIDYKQNNGLLGITDGLEFTVSVDKDFSNKITEGDSGSGVFVYDPIKKEWAIIGVVSHTTDSVGFSANSFVLQTDINDYMKKYENKNVNDISNLQADKDNFLASDIVVNSDTNLGIGGLVVENGKVINITGDKKFTALAGVDVEENATLNFSAKMGTELHKIGKGTLSVNGVTGNNLRVGAGIVNLNSDNAFNKIYITSGRSTVKLGDMVSNFNLNEVYFGNSGGKLDVNGHNLEAKNIISNDGGANIINSSNDLATLKFTGNDDKDTILHSTIGGTSNNNLNLVINNSHSNGKNFIFQSNVNIGGNLEIKEGSNVTIQGHPVTHAFIPTGDKITPEKIKQYDTKIPDYVDLNRPSTLEQPDWETVSIKTGGISLDGGNLNIGKYSEISSDINAKNSTLKIGGDINYFVDKFDGMNVKKELQLASQQEVESKILAKENQNDDTIKINGNINLDNSKMITNDLRVLGNTSQVSAINNSTIETKDFVANDNRLSNFTTDNTSKISFENIKFDMSKVHNYNNLNVDIKKSVAFENIGKNRIEGANFPVTLGNVSLANQTRINLNFDSTVTNIDDITTDFSKKYTLLKADKITGDNVLFDDIIINGKKAFVLVQVDNNETKIKFTKENPLVPTDPTEPNNPSNPSNPTVPTVPVKEPIKLARILGEYVASFGNDVTGFAFDYKKAAHTLDDKVRVEKLGKLQKEADDNFKKISENSTAKSMSAVLSDNNSSINSRLINRKYSYNIDKGNDFWIHANNKVYKGDESSTHKSYFTNVGYDKMISSSKADKIFGGMISFGNGKYEIDEIENNIKNYSFAGYIDYSRKDGYEIESSLVLSHVENDEDYIALREKQTSKFDGLGMSLRNMYKYKVNLQENENYQHFVKPILLGEISYMDIDGFDSTVYKQNKYDSVDLTLGAGVEYTLLGNRNSHTIQFLVSDKVYRSNEDVEVSLQGANTYTKYSLKDEPVSYELNYIGKTKLNEQFSLEYGFGGKFDDDGGKGYNVNLGIQYEF